MVSLKSELIEKIESLIAKHGHAVIATPIEVGDAQTWMAYTVGLSDAGLPEIAMFGVPQEYAQPILNEAARRLCAGSLPLHAPIAGIATMPLVFKPMRPAAAEERLLVATGRRSDVSALQAVWPDEAGKFPWEDGCNTTLHACQPTLYEGG